MVTAVSTFSCTKNNAGGDTGNKPGPSNTIKKDSGFVVIYTNSAIYTDPLKGTSVADAVNVSINNAEAGKISFIDASAKIYYKSKNTLSLKLPVGSIVIKGLTSSNASREVSANIIKNDTVKVNINYTYNDPNKDSYYIEYYDNGGLKKFNVASTLSKWLFYSGVHSAPYGTLPGCGQQTGAYNFDGPKYTPPFTTSPPSNVSMVFSRASWKLKPATGAFSSATGKLDLSCGGATVNCSIAGSNANLNVTDVKIIEDMGLEKRGYYSGTFDAVLYYSATFGAPAQKHIITQGKFMIGIGGISNN